MRPNRTGPGNLGYCAGKTYQEIGWEFERAYLGQGGLTQHDLAQMHRRWQRIGKQVAAGARITGRM